MNDEETARLREALRRLDEAGADLLAAMREAARGFADALEALSVPESDEPVKFGRGYPRGHGIDV